MKKSAKMTGYNELKAWMDGNYGQSSAEITITCNGKTYTGHMYGNDECFDGNEFYQYFLTADALLRMYYNIPRGCDDLGAIDYSAPYDVRDADAQYWIDYVMRDRAWRHWRYLAETSITEEDTMTDEKFYSVKEDKEEIPMTHEERMDRAMAEYERLIEEEENKKKEVIAMMTHEEMMNWAWEFIEGAGITEDEAEFQEDPDNIILVDDIYKVRDAYYDDLENGVNIELEVTPTGAFRPVLQDEDVYQFLDRHGIEWK